MNVKKFVAVTPREALRKVKETLGQDAIILSNRSVPGGVEIMAVAARDMAMIAPTPVRETPPPPRQAAPVPPARPMPAAVAQDDYRVSLSGAARRQEEMGYPAPAAAQPQPRTAAPRQSVPSAPPQMPARAQAADPRPFVPPRVPERPAPTPQAAPAAYAQSPRDAGLVREHRRPSVPASQMAPEPDRNAELFSPTAMMDEIRALRRMVEQHVAGLTWGDSVRREPVKTDLLRQMLDAGFSPRLARDLIADLPQELGKMEALAWIKGAADRSLQTQGTDNDLIDAGGVFALVGPTGVGKTTTTAKLAARCVLRHGAQKVALVTTDGYRIGAHEQLRIYGRILGVPVFLVRDASDLRQTLDELAHKHMVLIDTMGMSQRDKNVAEQIAMLSTGGDVRRLLCVSATSRGDTLDDVISAYRGDQVDGCILTKVDEAASLATAIDAIIRHGLRLQYVSNGQRVPEDLHLPNRAYLIHRCFKDLPEYSPHRSEGFEPALMMAGAAGANGTYGGRRG